MDENSALCFLRAVDLVRLIEAKEVSAREVMEAHLARIEAVDPIVNAIVTQVPERALAAASAADEAQARGDSLGPLHGLPIAHKDLFATAGIRTTLGSTLFAASVPDRDELIVARLRAAGAIAVGKTNTPEFGAGSQTYNEVFGETLNPWDTRTTCGGSSGGAAVALATGMIPIADGSDMGGSLRNPASFCNVVGLRTSPGRVPSVPAPGRTPAQPVSTALASLGVQGPMARTVEDAALVLSAIAGPDARAPISIDEPGARFAAPLARDFKGVRIAWSRDLGGLPVDPRVTDAIDAVRPIFEGLGCEVVDTEPDWSDANEIFQVLRARTFANEFEGAPDPVLKRLKETIVWNIEKGRSLTGEDVMRAERQQARLRACVGEFMNDYEFMILPVSQVPPFDVKERYVEEIAGVAMDSYIDWMKSCYYVSVTRHPAISVPCGFTPEGLPIGVQIVGRDRDDFGVLQLAFGFQEATGLWKRKWRSE